MPSFPRSTALACVLVAAGGAFAATSASADRGANHQAHAAGKQADARVSASASAKSRATRRLRGKMFTRFTESGDSSFDQRLHLCGDKSFIYDTQSSGQDPQRTEGRWRVTSARIRGRKWSARVRGVPEGGGRAVTVVIRTNGRRVTVDGALVFVEPSDLC